MESIDTKILLALIAAFVSFVGLLISKEQKTSEFRQAWINSLREEISRFLGEINSIQKLILINKTATEDKKEETSNAVIKESVKFREIQSKIQLLINPKEDKHKALVLLIETIIENTKRLEDNDENIKNLTKKSQEVLKDEWDRVKRGEPVFKFTKWTVGTISVGLMLYFLYQEICA